LFHNNSEHKQAVEGLGGRGSLPWKCKQRYLFTKYVQNKVIDDFSTSENSKKDFDLKFSWIAKKGQLKLNELEYSKSFRLCGNAFDLYF